MAPAEHQPLNLVLCPSSLSALSNACTTLISTLISICTLPRSRGAYSASSCSLNRSPPSSHTLFSSGVCSGSALKTHEDTTTWLPTVGRYALFRVRAPSLPRLESTEPLSVTHQAARISSISPPSDSPTHPSTLSLRGCIRRSRCGIAHASGSSRRG